MPIEQAQYLDTLTPEWPLGTDPQKDGDDHIRMIKQVLQNTFPNINAAITGTPAQLNSVAAGMIYQAADAANNWPHRWAFQDPGGSGATPLLAATATAVQLNAHPTLVPTWQNIRDMIYPVGTVLMQTSASNPSVWLGFGTWVAQKGYLAAVGAVADTSGLSHTIGAGFVAGNWRIQNSHIVAATLNLASGATNEAGAHDHEIPLEGKDNGGNNAITSSADENSANKSRTAQAPAHSHTVTGTITIGSGTVTEGNPFYQPRTAFYVWVRTA